jgi:hypothetical protein
MRAVYYFLYGRWFADTFGWLVQLALFFAVLYFIQKYWLTILGSVLALCLACYAVFIILRELHRWLRPKTLDEEPSAEVSEHAKPDAAQLKSAPAHPIARRADYLRALERIDEWADNLSVLSEDERIKTWGDIGEAKVLRGLEQEGNCLVYWGLGLLIDGRKTEYDILAVSPFGLLHVEVKHFTGRWERADNEPSTNPTRWQKIDSQGARLGDPKLSPFEQADRAGKMLSEAVQHLAGVRLPLTSVVFFPHERFQLRGINDYRMPYCFGNQVNRFLHEFVRGTAPGVHRVRAEDLARLVRGLQSYRQYPVFFDRKMFWMRECGGAA